MGIPKILKCLAGPRCAERLRADRAADPPNRPGHMRRSVPSRAVCSHWREIPGSRGGRWMLPGRSRDGGGVPAVVIRHGLLAGALGVPVVLLHGGPDTPHTWVRRLAALARGWVPGGGTVAARLPARRDPAAGLLRYRHAGDRCPRADPGARRRRSVPARRPGPGRADRLPGARRLPRGRAERRGDGRAASGRDPGVAAARRACPPVLPLVLLPAPAAGRPIAAPALAMCGTGDKRAGVMHDQARRFAGPYRFELAPGSSHFLQREQPQAATRLVLGWSARQ